MYAHMNDGNFDGYQLLDSATVALMRSEIVPDILDLQGLIFYGYEDAYGTWWWRVFNRVFAHKPGTLISAGKKSLKDVLRCPQCGQADIFSRTDSSLSCRNCAKQLKIDGNGIVILH